FSPGGSPGAGDARRLQALDRRVVRPPGRDAVSASLLRGCAPEGITRWIACVICEGRGAGASRDAYCRRRTGNFRALGKIRCIMVPRILPKARILPVIGRFGGGVACMEGPQHA